MNLGNVSDTYQKMEDKMFVESSYRLPPKNFAVLVESEKIDFTETNAAIESLASRRRILSAQITHDE